MCSWFTLTSESVASSLARLGVLGIKGRQRIETPAVLLDTKAGAVPNLTGDLVASELSDGPFGLNLHLGHLVKHPGSEGLRKLGATVAEFAILGDLPTFLSVQDPLRPMPHEHNSDSSVSVWDSGGRRSVSPGEYAAFCSQARPDLFESLSDSVQSGASYKRTEKSIRRSIDHLDFLIDAIGADSSSKLFASLEGGDFVEKRVAMAKLVSHKPVAGFAVNGITETSYYSNKVLLSNLLDSVHRELPPDKPRLLHGVGSPRLLLTAVASGADLFDGSYLTRLTERGLALRIPIEGAEGKQNEIVVDVSSEEFRDCFTPVHQGCACYTCANYTCAYLHHLQATKELLLPMLLMAHNAHQYLRFFAQIRDHLKKRTFQEFQKRIDLLTLSQNIDANLLN